MRTTRKGRESVSFVLGVGSGIAVESLWFLSPFFERILWETMCSYVKVVPVATLIVIGVIGLVLLVVASLFLWIKRM